MLERTTEKTPQNRSNLWLFAAFGFLILYGTRAWQAGNDDFTAYFNAGTRALHAISPYRTEETPFRYLPFTSFFFIPFSFFEVQTARVFFFALNFAAVIALYSHFRKKVGDLATFLIAMLFFRFHNHDFGNSQINPILLVLFFYWWEKREKKLLLAALAFAIFGSFKLLPFVLGLPMLVLKSWREIRWVTFWTILINFVPILFFENGSLIYKDWFDQAKVIGDPAMMSNIQALQSALWWHLEGTLSPDTFAVLSRTIQALLLGSVIYLAPKRNRSAWMFASTLAVTTLISPLAWKHNYLQLIPLVYLWFLEDPNFKERRTRILYGITATGLVVLPWIFRFWNREAADRLYFMPWTGVVIILLGLIFARRNQIFPIEK